VRALLDRKYLLRVEGLTPDLMEKFADALKKQEEAFKARGLDVIIVGGNFDIFEL
jgi:hypothetical protein